MDHEDVLDVKDHPDNSETPDQTDSRDPSDHVDDLVKTVSQDPLDLQDHPDPQDYQEVSELVESTPCHNSETLRKDQLTNTKDTDTTEVKKGRTSPLKLKRPKELFSRTS